MATRVVLNSKADLVLHCQKLLAPYDRTFTPDQLHIELYVDRPDTRLGWDKTYIVSINGYGIIGFTDEAG